MSLLYNIGLRIYYSLLRVVAMWHPKANDFVKGRSLPILGVAPSTQCLWIHCASHGEYETAKPIINRYRDSHHIHLTFYSPSGYDVAKDEPKFWHSMEYLPLDYASRMQKHVQRLDPKLVIFVQYEYWYNLLQVLATANVPTVFYGVKLKANSHIFKPTFTFLRKKINASKAFLVRDTESLQLAQKHLDCPTQEVGEVRWLQANATRQEGYDCPFVIPQQRKIVILGSAWKEDIGLWKEYIKNNHNVFFIIAPHDISNDYVSQLQSQLNIESERFSELTHRELIANVLFVDALGHLKYLYRYADVVYVGGGFGDGLHNCVEPAVYAKPIICGPLGNKHLEVTKLQDAGLAKIVQSSEELERAIKQFTSIDTSKYQTYIASELALCKNAMRTIDNELGLG